MASSTSTEAYNFQRPGATATRSLLSGNKPAETSSASSADVDTAGKPTLQRRTTDNYERTAAEAARSGALPATTAAGVAAAASSSSSSASAADRPGVLRQQSWKHSDFKGQHQGQMLARPAGPGYSSTSQ